MARKLNQLSDKADLKRRILADIVAHLAEYGSKHWDFVRENPAYAHVIGGAAGPSGERKFRRWVSAICQPTAAVDKTRPSETRDAAAVALETATRRARLAAERNLPAAPSPGYMLRAGPQAEENIDFLAEVGVLWADAYVVRDQSMVDDATAPGGRRIANGTMFGKSIELRIKVMHAALGVMDEIWSLEDQKRAYDCITVIIVDELRPYPELQLRVIERLEALNRQIGMTVHATPR